LKKIVLFFLLLGTLYAQEAGLYMGSSLASYNESFNSNSDVSITTSMETIKCGYGARNGYSVELSFDFIQNNSQIFSTNQEDGDRYGFNLALSKAFTLNKYLLPFVKVGFGSGTMKIERELQKHLSYGSYNLATGLLIPLNKHYDLEVGYEYRYISYESIDTIAQTIQYKSNANIFSLGINVRF
jgi:opacity protein-like surface antigen